MPIKQMILRSHSDCSGVTHLTELTWQECRVEVFKMFEMRAYWHQVTHSTLRAPLSRTKPGLQYELP
jgi:hypothetical protein